MSLVLTHFVALFAKPQKRCFARERFFFCAGCLCVSNKPNWDCNKFSSVLFHLFSTGHTAFPVFLATGSSKDMYSLVCHSTRC